MTTSSFFGKYILSRNNPPKLLEMMMNSSLHDEFLNPMMEGIHLMCPSCTVLYVVRATSQQILILYQYR